MGPVQGRFVHVLMAMLKMSVSVANVSTKRERERLIDHLQFAIHRRSHNMPRYEVY